MNEVTFTIENEASKTGAVLASWAKQTRFALERTVRSGAYRVRALEQDEMKSVFDRPTPFVVNSVQVQDEAKAALRATVSFRYPGGKAVPPDKVLAAEIAGGARRAKRAEVAFRRVGLLQPGYFIVPGRGIPADKLDAYGNVKGSFIVQLLSYFQAFSEVGYRANMTDRRKKTLAKFGRSEGGFRAINGVQYFVSYGRSSSEVLTGAGGSTLKLGANQHLPAGIWSRAGIHGFDVKPVLMFVRQPMYSQRFDFFGVGERVVRQELPGMHAGYLRQALETAR